MSRLSPQRTGIWLVALSIVLGSAAQILLKLGVNGLPAPLTLEAVPVSSLLWIASGLFCYALALLLWMLALSRYPLSFAYPLLSITYILVYLGAVLLPGLQETVSLQKTLGILLIVGGVILVTRSHAPITSDSSMQSR